MSLDSLFQQVLLTEQQQSEQIQKLKDGTFLFLAIIKLAASFVLKKNMRFRQQHCRLRIFVVFIKKKRYLSDICISVKVSIIKCNEKIKNATEKYENIKEELNKKAPRLCILRLQCDLMRKTEDLMLKHIEELSCQRNHLGESLAKIRRESKEEEEHFLQEISGFNRDFSLQGNKVTLLESQTRSELQLLQREEEALHKDLDGRLKEAKLTTESLKLESQFVSQKHLTDSTCVRLRKELEMYKEEELEQLNLKDALNSEIQFCQSRLDQLE
uniref:Coiled-coil domain-containing protein 172 n=1 Tax=Oryzias melastigma TaxID=30732 RepID=A0A3B3CDH4_ORYME